MLLQLLQQDLPLPQLVNTSCYHFKSFSYKILRLWKKSIISLKNPIHRSSWTMRSASSNTLKSSWFPRFLAVLVILEEIVVNFQYSNRRCWIISTVDTNWQQKGLRCLFYMCSSIQNHCLAINLQKRQVVPVHLKAEFPWSIVRKIVISMSQCISKGSRYRALTDTRRALNFLACQFVNFIIIWHSLVTWDVSKS